MKKAGIITQARMTSTRLPGKVLKDVGGIPMLTHHLRRLGQSNLPVIVATTTNETDNPIAEFCQSQRVPFYRGDEHNVLSRFFEAAKLYELSTIVRVTSDCPLIDGHLVRAGFDAFEALGKPRAYLSNAIVRTYPRGMDFEVFSFEALQEAHDRATDPTHREHVTPYFYKGAPDRFPRFDFTGSEDLSRFRLTVDVVEDFQLIKKLIEDFACDTKPWTEIVSCLKDHPELYRINEHVEQKKL